MPPRAHHGHRHTPGGGRGFGRGPGPGPGGWTFWGGPCAPGERVCFGIGALFWCCFTPPPSPPTVVIHEQNTYYPVPHSPIVDNPITDDAYHSSSAKVPGGLREVYAMEFRHGDMTVRYHFTLPPESMPGQKLKINLGGREFHINVPDYLCRGETIVVIAPAAVTYGEG